jgi:hypothetical protein
MLGVAPSTLHRLLIHGITALGALRPNRRQQPHSPPDDLTAGWCSATLVGERAVRAVGQKREEGGDV